jgi:hypothetical protein
MAEEEVRGARREQHDGSSRQSQSHRVVNDCSQVEGVSAVKHEAAMFGGARNDAGHVVFRAF